MSETPQGPQPERDQLTQTHDVAFAAGGCVGSYRLLAELGQGGMGHVWLAEQTLPVRRQVALKIIKAGMDSAQVIARFDAERQALALMDHPATAKMFEAGATAQGRPYFAMEYVRGESLTTYCDRQKLTTRERLELFLQLCDGVHHAHQKGIIHRDLKPSNILVTSQGDQAVPKINRAKLGAEHPRTIEAEAALGMALGAQREWQEAEPLLIHAAASLTGKSGTDRDLTQVTQAIVALYEAVGKPREAAEWRARLQK